MIVHLALAADWEQARRQGEYRVSTLGRTLEEEGFIHASTGPGQAAGVAERYYGGVSEPLVLLHISEDLLGCPVVYEVPPGAEESYPHIYGPIPVAAVTEVTTWP